MLANKRDKIRKQIRQEDLKRRFAVQRQALLKGTSSIFYEFQEEMRNLPGDEEYDFNCRLLACVEGFPEEESSYILIHQWLSRHNDYYKYFEPFLTAAPRPFDSYVWCLHLLLHMYLELKGLWADLDQRLRGIAIILTEISRGMMAEKRWVDMAAIGDDYILMVKRLIEARFNLGELVEPIQFSLECISKSDARNSESQQLVYYIEFLYSFKEADCWEFIIMQNLQVLFTMALSNIAFYTLRNVPQSRLDCLKLLEYLLMHQKDTHLFAHIHLELILKEILFLMAEIPALKETILPLLKLFLEEANRDEITLFLQLQVHVTLTRGVDFAMQSHNNYLLQTCLAAISNLLTRLKLNQARLLEKVKEDIEQEHFHHMIEGMLNHEQNQIIGGLINGIVDEFYSQEVQLNI